MTDTTTIRRFRKRPTEIEAVHFDGTNHDVVAAFTTPGCFHPVEPADRDDDPDIVACVWDHLHGTWIGVKAGMWVARGVAGEFYPISTRSPTRYWPRPTTRCAMTDLDVVVERHHHTAGVDSAVFSTGRAYRYVLARRWGPGPAACWVMLNPSTADAFTDDATLRRIKGFTRGFGLNALTVVNLYSLCSTDPAALWTHPDPVGPMGEYFLESRGSGCDLTIAAWGTHGARNGRGDQVAEALAAEGAVLCCLGLTAGGHPKHPLSVKGDTNLEPYTVKAVAHV